MLQSTAWLNDHSIDFKRAHVIDNFLVRKTLESWHTAITSEADNQCETIVLFAVKLPAEGSIAGGRGSEAISG